MKGRKKAGKRNSKAHAKGKKRSLESSEKNDDIYEFEEKSNVDFSRFDQEGEDFENSSQDELEEDEEIDEDGAFNSEDEEKYGHVFDSQEKGKSKQKQKNNTGSDQSDDKNIAEEGGVLITDLLSKMDGPKPKTVSKVEIKEQSDSEDEDEGDHEGLLDFIGGLSSSEKGKKKKKKVVADGSQKLQESELGYIRSGDSSGGKLTMDTLMNPIAGTKGFSGVKKQMQTMKKDAKPLAPAAAAVVEDRVQRETTYKESTKDMDKWQHFIKQNRDAETLDLSGRSNINMTNAALVGKFEPTTDMEKEIHNLLEKSLGKDYAKDKDEDSEDDLGMNEVTEEELASKHGDLAKMRALMSYQAQKSRHMKKIKSKTYRKIRKRKRQREEEKQMEYLEDHDPEAARELAEEHARKRVAERMTLRHKNQGKWAKLALQRGVNMDSTTKKAIAEQNVMHQQLRKKIERAGSDDEQSDSDSDDDEKNLSSKDRETLLKIGKGSTEKDIEEYEGKGKAIFKMKFMQRAMENQREQAKMEAQRLLEELEGVDEGSEDSNSDEGESDQDEAQSIATKSSNSGEEAKKAMAEALPKGSLQSKNIMMSSGTKTRVSGVISVNLDDGESNSNEEDVVLAKDGALEQQGISVEDSGQKQSSGADNPWLQQSTSKRANSSKKSSKKQTTNLSITRNLESTLSAASNQPETAQPNSQKISSSTKEGPTNLDTHGKDSAIGELSQEELIQRAFAAPDLEAEFKREKEEEINESSKKEITPTDRGVQGWGSWAGMGAPPPPKKPRHDLPQRKNKKIKDDTTEKREDEKLPTVIINTKRIKRSAKYKTGQIPYPFTSREQYEKAMRHPIGPEWNTTQTTKALTQPEVRVRAGKVISPGKLSKSLIKKHHSGELTKLRGKRPSKARL